MKICRLASLVRRVCHLWPASLIRHMCHLSLSSIFNSIPSSSDDDNEDENPPLAHEIFPYTPSLPRWVNSTQDVVGSLAGDPVDRRCTRSQFKRASSLLAQVPEKLDPETFEEASGHPDWDEAMNEEYHS